MLPSLQIRLSSHHPLELIRKMFHRGKSFSASTSQTRVIFTSACSLNLTDFLWGFRDRKEMQAVFRSSLSGTQESAITSSCSPPIPSVCFRTPEGLCQSHWGSAPTQYAQSLPIPAQAPGLPFVVKVRDRALSLSLLLLRAYTVLEIPKSSLLQVLDVAHFNWSARLEFTNIKFQEPRGAQLEAAGLCLQGGRQFLAPPLYPIMLSNPRLNNLIWSMMLKLKREPVVKMG